MSDYYMKKSLEKLRAIAVKNGFAKKDPTTDYSVGELATFSDQALGGIRNPFRTYNMPIADQFNPYK